MYCDVLIVGGGISGIIVIISADNGKNTVLIDDKNSRWSTIYQNSENFKINDEISSIGWKKLMN